MVIRIGFNYLLVRWNKILLFHYSYTKWSACHGWKTKDECYSVYYPSDNSLDDIHKTVVNYIKNFK